MQIMLNTFISRVTLSSSKSPISEEQQSTSAMVFPQTNPAYSLTSLIDDDPNGESSSSSLLQELSDAIESTKQTIIKMENSERFLDVRIRAYRQRLAECSIKTSQDSDQWTEEEKIRRVENQEKYHLQICDVMDVQRNILAQVEMLKRKCKELEDKRNELIHKTKESEELSMAHAALELEGGADSDEGGENLDEEQGKELEMACLDPQCGIHLESPSDHSTHEMI